MLEANEKLSSAVLKNQMFLRVIGELCSFQQTFVKELRWKF